MNDLNFDRRSFLKGLAVLTGSTLVEKAIPFNRVWFLPKKIEIVTKIPTRITRGNFAELLAPGVRKIFLEMLQETDKTSYFNIFNSGYSDVQPDKF